MNVTESKLVKSIKRQYDVGGESHISRLKAMDRRVKLPAEIFAYTVGIVGLLVLGVGMCLAMKVIFDAVLLGCAIGGVGIVAVSLNYPIYKKILTARKRKYGEEIIKLCNEIESL